MNNHLKEYYEEICSFCPEFSEKEIIEAGDTLLQIAKLLSDTVQETPELKKLIKTEKEKEIE